MSDINKNGKYKVETENLAVPEIVTGKVKNQDNEQSDIDEELGFEDLAIPEIHIKSKKKDDR